MLQHLKLLLERGAQPGSGNWVGETCIRGFDIMSMVLMKRFFKKLLEKEGWTDGTQYGFTCNLHEIRQAQHLGIRDRSLI